MTIAAMDLKAPRRLIPAFLVIPSFNLLIISGRQLNQPQSIEGVKFSAVLMRAFQPNSDFERGSYLAVLRRSDFSQAWRCRPFCRAPCSRHHRDPRTGTPVRRRDLPTYLILA